MRTVSIRTSLLRNVLTLVLTVSVTVLVVMFVGARRAVRDLSAQLVAEASDRAEESPRNFFDGIEGLTRTTAAWYDSGLLNYDYTVLGDTVNIASRLEALNGDHLH